MQKKRSAVWRHFSEEGENKVSCRTCHKRLTKHGNTSMMLRHLRGKHPELMTCLMDGGDGPAGAVVGGPAGEEDTWPPVAEDQQGEEGGEDVPQHDNSVKKKRSTVWRHFAEDGRDKVWCRLCNERLAKHGNTSSMLRHLRGKHPQLKLGDLQGEQSRKLNRLHLRSSNSESRFLSICERLLRHNQLTDCTLMADGHMVPAHRLVLATCSESFEEMFKTITQPNPVVVLRDVSLTELQGLLNYMYKGETLVKSHNLPGLLRAATQLKIKGLSQVGLSESWADDSHSSSSTTTPQASKEDLAAFYHDQDMDDDDHDDQQLPHTSQGLERKKPDNATLDLMAMYDEVELDENTQSSSNLGERMKRVQIKLEHPELDQAGGSSDTEMQLNDHLPNPSSEFLTEEEVVIHHEPLEMERGDGAARIGLRDPLAQAVKVAQCSDPQGAVAGLLGGVRMAAQPQTPATVQGAIEDGGLILLGLAGGEAPQDFPHPGPSHQSQPSSPLPPATPNNPSSPRRPASPQRPTPPRKVRKYSKQDLLSALNLIREGHIGIKPAARAFNIPVATLYNAAKRHDITSPMQQGANKDTTRSKSNPILVAGDGSQLQCLPPRSPALQQPTYLCFSRPSAPTSQ